MYRFVTKIDFNAGGGKMGTMDCDVIRKELLFFCMILCFCGFVQAASNDDTAENSEVKTARLFDLPAKWKGVSADKESKELWMACNAGLYGLKECSFEQDGFCDKLTLCNELQRLVFTIDRSVNVANSGELCNISVWRESMGTGFGRVTVSTSDGRRGLCLIFPDTPRSRCPLVVGAGAAPTSPQVPCCYNFGRSELTVRCFLYDDVAKKGRNFLCFEIDYKDFRMIHIWRCTDSLGDDALDGEISGIHYGAFAYYDCFSE